MGSRRVAIATQGTRGDFQPVLSLGIGLAKAGYDVKFFGNPGHCRTAEEFGFANSIISIEAKDLLASERGLKAMEKGDIILLSSAEEYETDASVAGGDTDWTDVFCKSVSEYKPDVFMWTPLVGFQAKEFMNLCPDVPAIYIVYQPHCVPTNHISPIFMQRLQLEPDQPLFYKWIMEAQAEGANLFEEAKWRLDQGEAQNPFSTPQSAYERLFNLEEQPAPLILPYSPTWWGPYEDWPKTGYLITGNWKIPKEEQEAAAKKGAQLFTAGGQHQACTDFIQAGEKPVYIGWGSMQVYSKEHMARLAVGALKEAGRRGIIVGGWAELSEESLGEGVEYAELKEYCKTNVLFLKSAPHEWLFPQCACCVHHGGIGTTQASLSAGVPTVVTPVFADQKDIAKKLAKDGHGEGTVQLAKLSVKELGEKIKKCCTDEKIIQNVKDLAAKMQQEDGVGTMVKWLDAFLKDEVATGKWQKKQTAFLDRLNASWDKQKNFKDPGQIFGKWNMDVAEKYPIVQAYMAKQVAAFQVMAKACAAKKLWVVTSTSGCLARQGEGLKTEEVGRYKEFAMLEELAVSKGGGRMHVRRLKGFGPDEGWVTPVVQGKDIIQKVTAQGEIQKIQAEAVNKQFADLSMGKTTMGQDKTTEST